LSRLAGELWASGLLKGDWKEEDHPRTGKPPNPGWFAPKQNELTTTEVTKPKSGWPSRAVNKAARKWAIGASKAVVKLGGRLLLHGVPIVDAITLFVDSISVANQGEDRLTAQLRANFDPPKTLEELQILPVENQLGYEEHHVVEQNDDNIEKSVDIIDLPLVKFGRDAIDDRNNIVWVPRLKHEKITADYNRKISGDLPARRVRDAINEMDYDAQRAAGLAKLREYGILQ
jgi:hypothetical protein